MENAKGICFNFNQICRFCLSQGGVMSAIFQDSGQDITSLPAKIMSCVPIQIYAEDGLPTLICHRCLYQVERSYEFKEQCEDSDATLRQYLKKQHMGDTYQVMSIKQENTEENGTNENEVLENGMMQYLSDCASPQNETVNINHEEENEVTFGSETSQENYSHAESFVVKVESNQLENRPNESPIVEKDNNSEKLSSVNRLNKESFEENVSGKESIFRPFLCDVCNKTFSHFNYLKAHMQLHSGIRSYKCKVCSKSFLRKQELIRHENVHSGERPYGCSDCGKMFSRRDKLSRHLKLHAEQKNHKCDLCPASFLRSEELTLHAMCHTGERPWCCTVCYKSFFSKTKLNRHLMIHADFRPWKCNLCTKAFYRKDKLTRHHKTHINKQYMHNFSTISYSQNESTCPEVETNAALSITQLSSPYMYINSIYNKEATCNEKVVNEEKEKEINPEISLSRLIQNPEILFFPISQQYP